MINNKTVAVVVPCYNEESQIKMVLETMPNFVDRIVVINDCSSDETENVIKDYISKSQTNSIEINLSNKPVKPNKFNKAEIVAQEVQKEKTISLLIVLFLTIIIMIE